MKKAILAIAVMALVGGSFTSCKKGENDPFLSLKSRKGRLTGEWKITSGEHIITYSNATGSGTQTDTWTGVQRTEATTEAGVTTSSVYNHTQTYVFEKDGSYTFTEVETQISWDGVTIDPASQSTNTSYVKGVWQFMKKSKEGDVKNKEAVLLTPVVTTYTSTSPNSVPVNVTYSGYSLPEVISIDQLKNKEMILLTDVSNNDGNSSYTVKGTNTYEKQ